MAKVQEKKKALLLRKQGKSIKDIAKKINVSKGSVSAWCQNIQLTKVQREKLKKNQIKSGNAGRALGAKINKQKKLDAIEKHRCDAKVYIGALSQRDLCMLGIGLYWGEGAKSRGSAANMVNSDPALILVSKLWFEKCLDVNPLDFRPYIYLPELHRPREEKVIAFWSQLLQLPTHQFKSPIYLKQKRKKEYENHDHYFGVIALRVRKGTDLKYRIQGLIKACEV